jgi:hypothetical protein
VNPHADELVDGDSGIAGLDLAAKSVVTPVILIDTRSSTEISRKPRVPDGRTNRSSTTVDAHGHDVVDESASIRSPKGADELGVTSWNRMETASSARASRRPAAALSPDELRGSAVDAQRNESSDDSRAYPRRLQLADELRVAP